MSMNFLAIISELTELPKKKNSHFSSFVSLCVPCLSTHVYFLVLIHNKMMTSGNIIEYKIFLKCFRIIMLFCKTTVDKTHRFFY